MSWGTVLVLVILIVVIVIAVIASRKHMKGQGSCCGGGSDVIEKKKLEGEVVAKKVFHIEGMHCENCKTRIEKQINRIDGALAEVNLKKNIAVVSMTREIPDKEIIQVIERLEYHVTAVTTEDI